MLSDLDIEMKFIYEGLSFSFPCLLIFELLCLHTFSFNPIALEWPSFALRTAKTLWSFDHFECNRVKVKDTRLGHCCWTEERQRYW